MRKWLYLTVFVSGMTTLASEMAASRLLGNYFGTSNLVWASIIGLILIYLSAGYFLGGRWADRSPHFHTFFQILIWGSFTIGLVPLASRPILRLAANAFDNLDLGVLFGSFTAVMVLFIIPITLLGTASPFAIRLALQDSRSAGSIAGRMYAISTLGSFFGTFLPVLILIPLVGTYRTFIVLSSILLLVALLGLGVTSGWRRTVYYLWMPVVLGLLAIYGVPGSDKQTTGMIFEKDSAYNYIQVLEFGQTRYLRLNDGQGVHSMYNPTELFYNGPWEQVLVAPFFNPPGIERSQVTSMAIVGLAAGTTARQAGIVYPQIQIDGIEIDPAIVAVGKQYFGMDLPYLNVIVQDGRWGLEHSPKQYQIISIDAYHPPYIPWHMTTLEFFQIVRQRLTDDGVMVINVGRSPHDRRLINILNSTILRVFPTVHIVDLPESFNSILFATMQPTTSENVFKNFHALSQQPDTPPLLLQAMSVALHNLQPAPPPTGIFTDDHAPIEWITNDMILDFLLSGEVETLQ
ncbi:MAG: fused MFS/spermidine synthase [Bellilinea sp.]|jgi:spermidine synthase